MALLSDEIRHILKSGQAFIIWREPDCAVVHSVQLDTYDAANGLKGPGVSIVPWPGDSCTGSVPQEATDRNLYLSAVARLVERLRERGGKTVLQRTVCGKFTDFDIVALAEDFFGDTTPTLDFIFYHPDCGYWIGRSPELLLETGPEGEYRTRALAGTRARGHAGEDWSHKNIAEHQMVADDICRRLQTLGLDVFRGQRGEFSCGAVSHLITPITAVAANPATVGFETIMHELHPTPAVGGYPRQDALADISELEAQPRRFYGGCINIGNRRAYVVLRCANFDACSWAVYTGSGITPDSVPEDEWTETEIKASTLVNFLSR